MDRRDELLAECDDEDEAGKSEIQQFYVRNLPRLMSMSLYSIDSQVMHDIAVMIHRNGYPDEWRAYVSNLGIRDNFILDKINETAKASGVMPMYFALRSPHCHDRSFGHLIKIFLEKRLDILKHIYSDVKEILENSFNLTTQVKKLVPVEEHSFDTSTKETISATGTSDLNSSNVTNGCAASGVSFVQDVHNAECRNSVFNHSQCCSNSGSSKMHIQGNSDLELHLKVLLTIPGTSENSNSTTAVEGVESLGEQSPCTTSKEQVSTTETSYSNIVNVRGNSCIKSDISFVQAVDRAKDRKHDFDKLQNCSNSEGPTKMQAVGASDRKELCLQVHPSAPFESLIILIQHTEFEKSLADELSIALTDAGFTVRTLSDIEHILMMDAMGALNAIFQEVNFIVPIVSETFLEQIRPLNCERYIESQDCMNNRTLYQLYMNEYRINRCVNFRVKPVLVPGFNRNLVKKDLIFSSSLRLWSEVNKFIRVLRETWQLIQNFPYQ